MTTQGFVTTRSTCPYCGVGCGVLLRPDGKGGIAVEGDPDHPANRGRLCSKGSALAETVGLEDRQLEPLIGGTPAEWDAALDLVSSRFRETIAEHGPDSVAFYVSGQMLTEDYYVANKLMKGYIGSANIDTNSRLCMASTVAGHKRAFGTDTVPGVYEDLEEADLIVLVGSNLAWCHPVLYQRILAAKAAKPGMKIVVVDPRRTASCEEADLHLPLAIGSDVALFNGLLAEISRRGLLDETYVEANVNGAEETLRAARDDDPKVAALSDADLSAFFDLWIGTPKVVTIFSQGVNQSSCGTDKVSAIINCHLSTGRIGRPGMGPFSVTGQPNAMGGREVGGLANTLACHLDLETPDHRAAVRTFWGSPAMADRAGLKAVDLFDAVADGRVKALWIVHSNPAVTLPDADRVRTAIADCPFTVVSDITLKSDTARLADVFLPASAWSEKSGTVTNSDRTISRQRAILPTPGGARADWAILADVGRRMGWEDGFGWESEAEIFDEYARLSEVAGRLGRDFDISGKAGLSAGAYADMAPFRWPFTATRQGGRFFGGEHAISHDPDRAEPDRFFHSDGKARMVPVRHRPPATSPCERFPFRLNTGRLRDQWHTMTRTGLSARLSAHLPEPFVDMHAEDARSLGLRPADLVRLSSGHGSAIVRLRIADGVRRGDLFAPMHWTGETAPSARIDALVAPVVDPVSGQPESKASPVSAERFEAAWFGFAIATDRFTPDCPYWARARTPNGFRAELAGIEAPVDWQDFARSLFRRPVAAIQAVEDEKRGIHRFAFYERQTLKAALYVSPEPVVLMRDYLVGLLGTEAPAAIAGRTGADMPDPGPTVCSCFGIGRNTVERAVEDDGLETVEAIGEVLSAGTNCGSCKSELAEVLASARSKQPA